LNIRKLINVVKDVELEAMTSSTFVNDDDDDYRLELPPIGCSSLAVDSVLPRGSAELGIFQQLLIMTVMTLQR